MIWFDNTPSWGSANYELQKLFMNNTGDQDGAYVQSDEAAENTLVTAGNTASGVERHVAGGKETMLQKDTKIETGRSYDVEVKVRGRSVALYLDGEKWGEFTDDMQAEPFRQVVTRDEATGDLIVKVVNAQESPARTKVALGAGSSPGATADVTTLAADPEAENTADAQPVKPEKSEFDGVAENFACAFPAHSVTFLRIKGA